ncbi:MAG: hypothetical protein CBD27_10095 [Rhodospirillaceae bacterium TMED167]|nr:hypothetical protein [Rhodospirillaceae bacterium]OUW24948.1 MAG: hypothetical protein CBD27_10095 [Rhodospirillaceae bacterium TMED167]
MAEENDPQQEPSMEDILASIRRILSEDEPKEVIAETPADLGVDPALAPEPAPEPEIASELEMEMDMASATEKMGAEETEDEFVPPVPEPETVPEEPESAFVPEIEPELASESAAEIPASFPPPPSGDPLFEDILELTQEMIAQPPSDVGAGAPILSGTAQVSSTDTLQELAKALLSRRDIAVGSREMTLEGLIREILRPLLREWLDENLPYLIERLVKKEIDHMVNRAERLDL